jgi:hypothetical protein
MFETIFFQCPGMSQPLDNAMPAKPPKVPFFTRERYVFMFLCKKIVTVDMALSWLVVIVPSGFCQARGQRTDQGVTWPCLDRDPEAGLVVGVSTKYSILE